MNNLEVAETIRSQICGKALFMIGAKNFVGDSNSFTFKIRASKKVSHIKILLEDDDTYTMTFYKISLSVSRVLETIKGVYFDMLKDMIASSCNVSVSI